MPQKPYCEWEKFKLWAKNGLDLKLRHSQAPKVILSGRYGDPYGRAGDLCRIRESWHVCLCCSYNLGWPLNVERMVDVMWCAARCLVLSARRGRYYSETLSLFNRPLPSSKNPHFQNEATCTTFLVKMSIICMWMKNDFHIKGWTPTLVLKKGARGNLEMAYSPHKTPVKISVMYVAGLQQSTGTSIVSALSSVRSKWLITNTTFFYVHLINIV